MDKLNSSIEDSYQSSQPEILTIHRALHKPTRSVQIGNQSYIIQSDQNKTFLRKGRQFYFQDTAGNRKLTRVIDLDNPWFVYENQYLS